MKISNKTGDDNKNCARFETIGTVFAYQERLFYPNYPESELSGYPPKQKKEILGTSELNLKSGHELGWGKQTDTRGYIMFPSTHISDLTENSLYDFCFNLLGDKKYIPKFYPGLLDDYSQDVLESSIDIFSTYMVPQTSSALYHFNPVYFGGFQDKNGVFIKLIHVPAGVWKLEIYNESRITSNIYFQNRYRIIDHDTLIAMGTYQDEPLIPLYTPCLKIYFGPEHDTRIEDQSIETLLDSDENKAFNIYTDRYFSPDSLKDYYGKFPNVMSETEYVESYKGEVMSDKILYLAYTGDGEVKEIKLIEASFDHHKNPGRNQRKLSMRMDDYLAHDFSPIEDLGCIALDKSSGVILGTREGKGSWFFDRAKEMALPSLRTPRTKKVNIDGKEMVNGNRERIYQNPIISQDWIVKRDIESDYTRCRISLNQGGTIYRSLGSSEESIKGIKYFKKGTNLILRPEEDLGYKLLSVTPLPESIEDGYYKYITIPTEIFFEFEHKVYTFRVHITCDEDYFAAGGSTASFNSGNYDEDFIKYRGIKIYFGDTISGFKEYSKLKSRIIQLDETTEISFKLDLGDYYVPVSFNPGEVFKVKLKDLDIVDAYADYRVKIAVIKPSITLYGDVDFGKNRHITCDFNGTVKLEFYSPNEIWNIPKEAIKHIFIKRGSEEIGNPTIDSESYDPGSNGFRYLTLYKIISNTEINIWTQE